jgi:hypothetical protein
MRRHELQNMLKLVWRVGIYLGSQAHLGKAEPSKLKQRIVPCDASLKQAMNRPEHPTAHTGFRDAQFTKTPTTWAGTIHDPHPTASQMLLSSSRFSFPVISTGPWPALPRITTRQRADTAGRRRLNTRRRHPDRTGHYLGVPPKLGPG